MAPAAWGPGWVTAARRAREQNEGFERKKLVADLRPLTDEQLLARLEMLVSAEREALGDIIEHLIEADRRDNIFDRGYGSLYDYCRRRLGYSEFGALARIRAARACRDHPEVLPKIRSGELHLDAIARLYPHLTADNTAEVLKKASGATSREVMALVSELKGPDAPKPDKISFIGNTRPATPLFEASSISPAEVIPPPRRIRLDFEADETLLLKIDRLKSLLRHKYPFPRLEDVLLEAADALLAKIDPDRRAVRNCVQTQLRTLAAKRGRRVPAAVKRLVWERDGGRCAFIAPDGRRCESVDALQYDHLTPYAVGGRSDDPANIRLLCRPHNQRLARKRFGPRRRS